MSEKHDPLYEALTKKVGLVSADDTTQIMGWVSTGNYALNWAVSNRFLSRGWALGTVAEIAGDPATGKTFLLARALAEAQAQGAVTVLDDTENRMSKEWWRKLGVDTARMLMKSSDSIEQHTNLALEIMDAYDEALKKGEDRAVVIALDSLGILSTDKELEDRMEKADMTRAKQIRKAFRLLTAKTKQRPYLWLCANHTYTKVGDTGWGGPSKESSGGGGAKYQATVRVNLSFAGKVGDYQAEDADGVIVRANVIKNSVTVPFRRAELVIPFDRPISPTSGLVDKLLALGYLGTTAGHNLTWLGEDTGIKAHKSEGKGHAGRMNRDESAEELVAKYPDLLAAVDADLEVKEQTSA